MAAPHPYEKLTLPDGAPFKLMPTPGKGWGVFATKSIKSGSIILREKPLFKVEKHENDITEQFLLRRIQSLSLNDMITFLSLRDQNGQIIPCLEAAFCENCYQLYDKTGTTTGWGMYVLLSRFNQSCAPNAMIPRAMNIGDTIACIATQDIAVGEEITTCYDRFYEGLTKSERCEQLRFDCLCKICTSHSKAQKASDIRRTMIRALQYILLGKDIYAAKGKGLVSNMVDPSIKEQIQSFQLPLTTMFVCKVLIIVLMEAEELLTDQWYKEFGPIEEMICRFESQSNKEVVLKAMAMKTWL